MAEVVLVDASAWIRVGIRPLAFRDLVPAEALASCPPIIQEVLQGAGDEPRYRKLRMVMHQVRILDAPMPLVRYEEAAMLYMLCRKAALTIRKANDCLIAACALAHGVAVMHHDRDFEHIARVAPLKTLPL